MTITLQLLGASGRRLLLLGYSADYACLHLQTEPGQPGDSPVGQAEISSVMQYWTPVAPPLALGGRARALAARHANFTLPLPPSGNGPPGSATGKWTCPKCGNINFAFREKCDRCNMPRPGAKLYGPMAAVERRICPLHRHARARAVALFRAAGCSGAPGVRRGRPWRHRVSPAVGYGQAAAAARPHPAREPTSARLLPLRAAGLGLGGAPAG
mmetsp:Transcript_40333/g.130564  ORF Transcript_40333/g.130564 Transcript_40333/m.130564 type:complete len:213 (-) Transcript_40333:311-949(-)